MTKIFSDRISEIIGASFEDDIHQSLENVKSWNEAIIIFKERTNKLTLVKKRGPNNIGDSYVRLNKWLGQLEYLNNCGDQYEPNDCYDK